MACAGKLEIVIVFSPYSWTQDIKQIRISFNNKNSTISSFRANPRFKLNIQISKANQATFFHIHWRFSLSFCYCEQHICHSWVCMHRGEMSTTPTSYVLIPLCLPYAWFVSVFKCVVVWCKDVQYSIFYCCHWGLMLIIRVLIAVLQLK